MVARVKANNCDVFMILFLVDVYTLSAHFQIGCLKLQSDIQLEDLIMSLYQTSTDLSIQDKKYPLILSLALFI